MEVRGGKTGHRGLLRHLVRPLQSLRTHPGRRGQGIRRQSGHLQGGRGPRKGIGAGIRHPLRPHPALHPGFGRTQHGTRRSHLLPTEGNHRQAIIEIRDIEREFAKERTKRKNACPKKTKSTASAGKRPAEAAFFIPRNGQEIPPGS